MVEVKGGRILVVDRDAPTRAARARILRDAGHTVFDAGHLSDAALLRQTKPELLVLDAGLHDSRDAEFSRALEEDEQFQDAMVLRIRRSGSADRPRGARRRRLSRRAGAGGRSRLHRERAAAAGPRGTRAAGHHRARADRARRSRRSQSHQGRLPRHALARAAHAAACDCRLGRAAADAAVRRRRPREGARSDRTQRQGADGADRRSARRLAHHARPVAADVARRSNSRPSCSPRSMRSSRRPRPKA